MAKNNQKSSILEHVEALIIVVVFAIILIAGYFLLIQPELQHFLAGGKYNDNGLEQQLVEKKAYLKKVQNLKTTYETSQTKESDKIALTLPKGENIPDIFVTYESIAKKHGLGLQAIDIVTPEKRIKGTKLGELLISIKLAGADYETFKDFLRSVEKTVRIADVQSVSFDPKSHFVDLNIKSYFSK